ncbi:MAG: hypothetical protein DWQ07_16385 [Chloroflexi bacterium]|nr:MAG: hypothetical protein DWQ07_16385 [Chloroflexota bacterium]MBL1195331.1 hypothetical protein [Chloroflexota bacterium]NOH12615.1 hypothetical protein [Chloroflexota bacterium]
MKMIISILQTTDKDNVSRALNEAGYALTVLPSTGAYLRRGNSTLLIGVEDEKVQPAIEVVKENCAEPSEPGLKRATVFVLDVDHFQQV